MLGHCVRRRLMEYLLYPGLHLLRFFTVRCQRLQEREQLLHPHGRLLCSLCRTLLQLREQLAARGLDSLIGEQLADLGAEDHLEQGQHLLPL